MKKQKVIKGIKLIYLLTLISTISFSVYAQADKKADGEGVKWYTYDEAIELIEYHPKKILLFLEADWCSICKEMKREIFPRTDINSIMNEKFYPVRIDIESNKQLMYQGEKISEKQLSKRMKIYATPTFIFLDEREVILGNKPGFIDAEELKNLLAYIYSDAYQLVSFQEYQEK